jgi:VWFA-related protein
MKRVILPFMAALILPLVCFTQQPLVRPTPTPPPAEDGEVVRISTEVIQLDVTVTDSRGRVVRNLRPDEFEIYQNGKKQQVTNISFVSNAKEESEDVMKSDRKDRLALPMPPGAARPENVRRTMAIVVDDLSLSFHSASHTRRALRKFVDEQVRDGDMVAIIRTGAGIGALQQFTTDKRILYAAVDRVKWNPVSKSGISAFAPIQPSMLELAASLGDSTVSQEDLEQERNFNNSVNDSRDAIFTTGTLGAVRYIVNGMGQLPGRKSVILFSEGFSIMQRDSQGFSDGSQVIDHMQRLVDAANRASVVFYTIDPRGLQYTGLTAADKVISPSPQAINRIYSERSAALFDSQAGTDYLAKQTGGLSVINTNDLSGAIGTVLNDQSYYLIAYEPDSGTFDLKKLRYNDIEIKVTRKDTNVRYRSGFLSLRKNRS